MKLQLAFRDTGHREGPYRAVAATGLIEYPESIGVAAHVPEGMIGRFVLDCGSDSARLWPLKLADMGEFRTPRDAWGQSPGDGVGVPDMLTERVWLSPFSEGHCELFLRRTLVEPSAPGLAVMCLAGFVALKDGQPMDEGCVFQLSHQSSCFVYEGRVGVDVRPEWGDPEIKAATRGQGLGSFLRHPAWGFGEEAVGLPWHMSLGLAREYDRYRELALADGRGDQDEREHAALRQRFAMEGLDMLDRDPEYRAFARAVAEGEPMRCSCADPLSRSASEELDRRSAEVMASLHAGGMRL